MNARDFANEVRAVVVTVAAVWALSLALVIAAALTIGGDLVVIIVGLHIAAVVITARTGWKRLVSLRQSAERSRQ